MTEPALLSLFDYLCNEARNAVHASFGLMEFRPAEAEPAWQTCVDATRTSADRLLRVIDDVRELMTNQTSPAPAAEEFDLSLCLGETVELLNLAFSGRDSRLVLEASSPLAVRQNRQALEQLLARILNAAAKLSRNGVVRVSAGGLADGGFAEVAVTPPNSDLSLRLAEWLNADLAQWEFSNIDEVAWGVPLLVAGQRLRGLGGRAEFVCQPGAPTGLALFLPCEAEHTFDGARHDAPSDSLNILVAEDCDESFALTELLLLGETVSRAQTGLEAVDLVKKHRFDVVLMDIHMPGMDGYRAIRTIREWETYTSNARTPIVILSSDDLATQAQEAAQSGCSGFLRKPLRNADLSELLARLKGVRELVS